VSLDDAELETPRRNCTHWTVRITVQMFDKKSVVVAIVGKCEICYNEKQIMIPGMFVVRFL